MSRVGMKEPWVAIEGKTLSGGQAATVRVALESFAASLESEGLGDDSHGKAMTQHYLRRIGEIRSIMYPPCTQESQS